MDRSKAERIFNLFFYDLDAIGRLQLEARKEYLIQVLMRTE